jgi:hypothetical protein
VIKLIDLLENKMTPAQKKKRGEIFDKLVAGGMAKDKAGPIATDRAMKEATFTSKYNDDPKLKGKQKKLPDELQAQLVKEGDHEVSMAVSSLEAIAEAIVELRQKLGNQERNIPGWIQDHIAKAENYIEQAAQGFHELKHNEMNEQLKRMQQLAGMVNENQDILREDIEDDIDDDLLNGDFKNKEDQIAYLEYVIEHCQKLIKQIEAQIAKGETFDS